MSIQQIRIRTPGGEVAARIALEPEMTAAQALEAAGLDRGFVLSTADGQFIQGSQRILTLSGQIHWLNSLP